MSQNNWPFVINVGNSIIGVTILAMPFCFQACGIVLGTLLLLFATWLTIVSCELLMKAGVTARRRSYSLLAFFTHGALGKMIVEVGMIGLQLGTLIAQVVIIGDLGPAILSKATGLQNSENLRTGLIVVLCLFVGLPLGLLKDVRTLSKTSSLCIAFYAFFTFYIVALSLPNLIAGDWYNRVNFWRMEGFFQCLPIFSFAFGCQTQLFIVYDALADPSLKRINGIVSSAVNMCTVSYLLVGFFGYIAFCNAGDLSGDIINHFRQNTVCDAIKLLFVFSISVTIPLIVFPCRASLYTLCFPHVHKTREDVPGGGKIPETHFKVITIIIIVGSMIIGILIPNIEFVLGINGATMGTLICYIFPALFFLSVMSDKAEGLFTGKVVLVFGFTIMIASTYTILTTESTEVKVDPLDTGESNPVLDITKLENSRKFIDSMKGDMAVAGNGSKAQDKQVGIQERQEPPIPQEPQEPKEAIDQLKKDADNVLKKSDNDIKDQSNIDKHKQSIDPQNEKQPKDIVKTGDKVIDKDVPKEDKNEPDKIKQEEKLKETEKKQDEILAKLEQQQEQQEKLIQEQKEILEQLKEHKDSHKDDEVAPNLANKQLPLNLDQNQPVQNNQGLQQPGNSAQIEKKPQVDVQIPQHNQQAGVQIPQHNQQARVQIPQQNQQAGVLIPQQNQQAGVQIPQQNQQAGVLIPQQNQQAGVHNLQQNQQAVFQNLQQNQQAGFQNLQQNQQAGIQVPQQNQQPGVPVPQQNFGQDQQGNAQVHQKQGQPNFDQGQQMQFQKQQLPQDQMLVQQGVMQQMQQGETNVGAPHHDLGENVNKYLRNQKEQLIVNQQPQEGLGNNQINNKVVVNDAGDNIGFKHRGKRDTDVIESNRENVPETGILSDNDVNNANQGEKNDVNADTQVDSFDKKNIVADTVVEPLDKKSVVKEEKDGTKIDGENDVINKESHGQRDLKQVPADAENAQYGGDSYINEVLNHLKNKIDYNVSSIGKAVINKIGMFKRSKRRL
ncbi:putative sodium-coupled neutral amino acid transporter 10 [Mercenaria mercenaria]|uniref:putative sodium-coupled neutral amino acid transporter 10 n=1 Tax=Mercenaria mercenaria TaxID=6596 RepID=UPI00234E65F9|nr:putative sodium-coupled neutral amino acid transporter 10 [Mercenaria mercenaria]XP_053384598.1 putative sodium-coupled neutral amino acid transporter 10 [Mercenaria mercenaria]XP_053384601.1 putative sodium-coupled neutral amino acid transporter 10 [Mercenaria mercenaria]XP_053384607.1 putative sodium-coupled neutral amino acid transporter 10 [Mercenaria mercenaria]